MGAVYKAERTNLQKLVALKVLRVGPDVGVDQQLLRRFRTEARLACRLQHPNVAQVFDYWEEDSAYFMAMEYVEGADLSEIIEIEAPLSPSRSVLFAKQIAAALIAAERAQIVHRDIKPSNIRITDHKNDRESRVKVLDLGIAKRITANDSGSERNAQTVPGVILGTPAYMAPEQISEDFAELCHKKAVERGDKQEPLQSHVDHRTDLFAVGVVLFEMLTKSLPFPPGSSARLFRDAEKLPDSIPQPLADLVTRLLRRDPYERPASARELFEALSALEPSLTPVPVSVPPPAAGWRGGDLAVTKKSRSVPLTPFFRRFLLLSSLCLLLALVFLLLFPGARDGRSGFSTGFGLSQRIPVPDLALGVRPAVIPDLMEPRDLSVPKPQDLRAGSVPDLARDLARVTPPRPTPDLRPASKKVQTNSCLLGYDTSGQPIYDGRPECRKL